VTGKARPTVKLLGERSTGTNLMQGVLAGQFDLDLAGSSSGVSPAQKAILPPWYEGRWASRRASREAIQDHNHWVELPENGGWKHAAASARFLSDFVRPRRAIVLCQLRHPADWVMAMHRNPFHGIGHVPRRFADFLRSPWIAAARDELGKRVLANPLQLYRAKVESYLALAEAWEHTALIRYEDFVLDPEGTLGKTPVWPYRRQDRITLPETSARPFGRSRVGTGDYRGKAGAASYDTLSPADRDFVLAELAGSALLRFYPAEAPGSRPPFETQ